MLCADTEIHVLKKRKRKKRNNNNKETVLWAYIPPKLEQEGFQTNWDLRLQSETEEMFSRTPEGKLAAVTSLFLLCFLLGDMLSPGAPSAECCHLAGWHLEMLPWDWIQLLPTRLISASVLEASYTTPHGNPHSQIVCKVFQ